MRKKRSVIWTLPKKDFQKLCFECDTLADILRFLGLHVGAGNYRTLKTRIKEDEINISHIKLGLRTNSGRKFRSKKVPFEEVFCLDSKWKLKNQSRIKRLFDEEVWQEWVCNICKNPNVWMEKKLVLQLDHINGNSSDNRVENLRLLCPNCHSQTRTFSGRNTSN